MTAEQFLLDFFHTSPNLAQIEQCATEKKSDWSIFYHLTPQRLNLLDWFDFNPHTSLLEVGAGNGALTGFFTTQVAHVTALEPDPARCEVLHARYQRQSAHQLQILPQSLSQFTASTSSDHFDYITLIGVLEYASQFYSPSPGDQFSPYLALLQQAVTQLKSYRSQLIIAIENRLGLKYWNGCVEDHTSQHFSSLENYPNTTQIQTFTQAELTALLHQAGLTKLNWYYPFPDYKLPQTILNDYFLTHPELLPSTLSELWADGWQPGKKLNPFTAASVAAHLQKEQISARFAPSFLVIASR